MLIHGGFAMSSTLKFCLFQRSFSTRLLQTTTLSLALMTASAAGVRADDIEVGATGTTGLGDPASLTSVPAQAGQHQHSMRAALRLRL